MAIYTVLFIKFDLINNGFSIIHEDDISIQLVRVIINYYSKNDATTHAEQQLQ
jgi:hypothetical protein